MIDHFTISVADLAASRAFYEKILAPLGYEVRMEFGEALGFGDFRPYFWVKQAVPATTPQHIAFVAKSRADVDAFHAAALAAGARDDGAPGLRPHYHPNYYGAFIIDPHNGHPIEAVCHDSPKVRASPAKKAPARKAKAKAKAKKSKDRSRR